MAHYNGLEVYVVYREDKGEWLYLNGGSKWYKKGYKTYSKIADVKTALHAAAHASLPMVTDKFRDPSYFAKIAKELLSFKVWRTRPGQQFSDGGLCVMYVPLSEDQTQDLQSYFKEYLAKLGYTDQWIEANLNKGAI